MLCVEIDDGDGDDEERKMANEKKEKGEIDVN